MVTACRLTSILYSRRQLSDHWQGKPILLLVKLWCSQLIEIVFASAKTAVMFPNVTHLHGGYWIDLPYGSAILKVNIDIQGTRQTVVDTWCLMVNFNKTHHSALLRSGPGMRLMPPVQFYIWGEVGSRITSWWSSIIKHDDQRGSENRWCSLHKFLLTWQCSYKLCLMSIFYGYIQR